MKYISLNEDGFAEVSGWINCHVADFNGEYVGRRDEYISATTGLPAGAYLDEPPEPIRGKAIVRGIYGWELVEDHRGKISYSTTNRSIKEVNYLGVIADGYTISPPATDYDKWSGKEWVTDVNAQNEALKEEADNKKERLRSESAKVITVWQTKLLLGRKLSDADSALLYAWLDYIDIIEAIDTSKASAESPVKFPAPPAR